MLWKLTVETKEHPKDKKLEKFPIDGHRDEICAHVRNNRITIIHGETGCGKSSRVPQMLVEDLGPKNVRMYISQPRRIAATSLKKRVGEQAFSQMDRRAPLIHFWHL